MFRMYGLDLPCMYLAHHESESVLVVIVISYSIIPGAPVTTCKELSTHVESKGYIQSGTLHIQVDISAKIVLSSGCCAYLKWQQLLYECIPQASVSATPSQSCFTHIQLSQI